MKEQELLDVRFDIREPLLSRFDHPLILASIIVRGARNAITEEFDSSLYKLASEAVDGITLEEVKNDSTLRAYRDFYWRVCKIDPTKIRPSAEALIRRMLRKKPLPNINKIVNAYNVASIETRISIGAYDVNTLRPPLIVRNANDGEEFYGIGMNEPKVLSEDMLILADSTGPINILPYRDADRSKVTLDTTDVLLVGTGVWGINEKKVITGIRRAAELITQSCGGNITQVRSNVWKKEI